MPELKELVEDIPADILNAGNEGDDAGAGGDDQGAGGADDDAGTAGAADEGEEAGGADEGAEGEEGGEGEDEGAAGAAAGDDNDDYVTSLDDDEETPPAATTTPPAATPPVQTDENTFVLQNLNKIAVRVVVPGAKEGETDIQTVEVYGYGDLPRNYLGFASQYEAGIFNQSVMAQETKAQSLQNQFRQQKIQDDTQAYTRLENKAIADDLTELRQEGVFPKFKGVPGSKEFNDSEGAKMFDKVVAYQTEQNLKYQRAANSGKAFRHIGFREAYIMLNGPNPKAADQADARGRRAVASRLTSGRGTKSGGRNVSTKPVQNITDLEDEFAAFTGNGGAAA